VMLALIVLAKAVFVVLLTPWFFWYPEVPAFAEVLAASLRNNLWITLMVTGIAHALIYFEREQHIQLKLAKLESSLATAQLASLSAQLNPHFLFNALNSVAELVHHDAIAADRMLVALSSLLRRSLDAVPMQVGLLKDELALLHSYLDIEKVRLGERLQLSWAIDEACLEALVPVLILQPIVENAIVHAIAKRQAPGLLSVRIEREQAHLVMRVSDSGGGPFNADRGSSSGIGLSNTRGRLQQIYGDSQAVLLTQNDTGGTTVIVRLPYRTDPTKLKWEEWLHESSAHRNR
jgi:LytS/YehU family sensor histidine kinase